VRGCVIGIACRGSYDNSNPGDRVPSLREGHLDSQHAVVPAFCCRKEFDLACGVIERRHFRQVLEVNGDQISCSKSFNDTPVAPRVQSPEEHASWVQLSKVMPPRERVRLQIDQ